MLHGDIAQSQRETTLKAFRTGKFRCLIATDVAARGLDITGIDLVVQLEVRHRDVCVRGHSSFDLCMCLSVY